MHKKLTGFIETRLEEGREKIYIERELSEDYNKIEYKFILANYPEKTFKKRYKILNAIVMLSIVILSLLKIYQFFFFTSNLDLIIRIVSILLIVIIPVYILKHVVKMKRSGYLLLMVASVVGLFLPLYNIKNTSLIPINIESTIIYADIFISSFLLLACIFLIKKIYGSFSY